MEKSVKDNPEYKMKRQGMIIGLVCLAVMVFLTIFSYEQISSKNRDDFYRAYGGITFIHPFGSTDRMENFLAGSAGADKVEEAWETLNEDEGNVLHYVCNSDGENPGRRYADF